MVHVIRAIFLILVSVVAAVYLWATVSEGGNSIPYLTMFGSVVLAFAIITVDLLLKRKNLSSLSGLFLGIVIGVLISLCLGYLIDQLADTFLFSSQAAHAPAVVSPDVTPSPASQPVAKAAPEFSEIERMVILLQGLKLLLGLMVTYLTTSFVLQTKDDFRFIIPYVEFQRATKGPRPIILDTSVIIDGRVADMASTGVFETSIIVPRFVLNELQTIADSGDRLKRMRGRRGLEVLEKLKALPRLELRFWDGTLTQAPPDEGVDQKLVTLAQQEGGRIVTNDYNLNKVAGLRGVSVININAIADALKPVVLPGESMKVRIIKPGENSGQGVGYLEDGTMVVVEGAREKVGAEIEIVVTNMIQNPAGKMIFGRAEAGQLTAKPFAMPTEPSKSVPAKIS